MNLIRPARADMLPAVVVAAVTTTGSVLIGVHQHTPLHVMGYLLALVAGGALAWWRTHPTAVVLVVFGCHLLSDLVSPDGQALYLPLIIAFGVCIVRGDRRVGYGVLAAGYAVAVGGPALTGHPAGVMFTIGLGAWFLLLASVAELTRIRAQARRAQAARAADQAARRVSEERLRIAADLHDVLAHQLALITVQANAGLALLPRDPQRVDASLHAIKDAGNTALAELRIVLDSLKTSAAPRRPTPLLSRDADLDPLLDGAQGAGLLVHKDIVGRPRVLPAPVDQTAYRIVQEALTNAVRHAGPGTSITLTVDYTPGGLHLVVADDGAGVPASGPGGGNGLPGMRERVGALGGTVDAGPHGNGFRVAARLPTGRDEA